MSNRQTIRFGPFRFVPRQRLLLMQNRDVKIGNRALAILAALIERAGTLVTKDELIACVWPNSVVEEINLRVHMSALRRALRDGQAGARYIVNSPGLGYSFVAPVRVELNDAPRGVGLSFGAELTTLPLPLTRMTGRAKELDVLVRRSQMHRLVTIVGPAGVGKSTLAIAAANQMGPQFEHGCLYLDLAKILDPTLVTRTVVAAIERKSRSDEASSGDLAALVKDKRLLLILDNCEHVIAEVAALSERLLRHGRHLHILATSREGLGCEAEWQHASHPLDVPDELAMNAVQTLGAFSAVSFFVERAAASLPGFKLTDSNACAVVDICRRLDGIPLAIDLAAARVNLLNVREIASQPDARFLEAINGRRTATPRHQTLRAALGWSIEGLGEREGLLLQRLSVFHGSFTLQLATSLAARQGLDCHDVSDGLMSLTDKSLVRTDTGHGTRHRLLRTVRMYALEKLASSPDMPMIYRWHAEEIFRALHGVAQARQTLRPMQLSEDFKYLVEDARVAVKWASSENRDPALAAEIADALRSLSRTAVGPSETVVESVRVA